MLIATLNSEWFSCSDNKEQLLQISYKMHGLNLVIHV